MLVANLFLFYQDWRGFGVGGSNWRAAGGRQGIYAITIALSEQLLRRKQTKFLGQK
jgi:hypothetical protein